MAVAFILWRWNWPKLMFVEALVLTWYCWRRKKIWSKRDNKSLFFFLFDKGLECLVPVCIVLLFYACLALVVDGADDHTTLGRLESLEHGLDWIHSHLQWLILKPWTAALIIVAVIVVDAVLTLFLDRKEIAASWYKQYGRWNKRISTIALLLCCFTFFGNAAGERRAHLRTRTDKIKEGYAPVREEAKNALAQSVQAELFDRVRQPFLPEIQSELDDLARTNEKIKELRVSLEYADVLGVKDENANAIITRHETRLSQDESFLKEPIRYADAEPASPRSLTTPPPETTEASIKDALSKVETKSAKTRFISLLKLDGTKELLCQFPKSFTKAVKSAAFKAAIARYPVLEPMVDAFGGVFDKAFGQMVNEWVDNIAAAIVTEPGRADTAFLTETKRIVSAAKLDSIHGRTPENIGSSAVAIKNNLKEIQGAIEALEVRMNEAAAARGSAADDVTGNFSSGRVICTCFCGSRKIWGPTEMSDAQCTLSCPTGLPCQ